MHKLTLAYGSTRVSTETFTKLLSLQPTKTTYVESLTVENMVTL